MPPSLLGCCFTRLAQFSNTDCRSRPFQRNREDIRSARHDALMQKDRRAERHFTLLTVFFKAPIFCRPATTCLSMMTLARRFCMDHNGEHSPPKSGMAIPISHVIWVRIIVLWANVYQLFFTHLLLDSHNHEFRHGLSGANPNP